MRSGPPIGLASARRSTPCRSVCDCRIRSVRDADTRRWRIQRDNRRPARRLVVDHLALALPMREMKDWAGHSKQGKHDHQQRKGVIDCGELLRWRSRRRQPFGRGTLRTFRSDAAGRCWIICRGGRVAAHRYRRVCLPRWLFAARLGLAAAPAIWPPRAMALEPAPEARSRRNWREQ